MDLPVTFDDPSVDYGLSGFGGAENSSIVSENGNASNKVGKVVKSATANTWAGTTITAAAQLGFATPIPFDKTKEIKVRVFSPDAGIPVRLKFEDHGNNTHTVETEAMVTVANQWDTLTFNFSNPAWQELLLDQISKIATPLTIIVNLFDSSKITLQQQIFDTLWEKYKSNPDIHIVVIGSTAHYLDSFNYVSEEYFHAKKTLNQTCFYRGIRTYLAG